MMKLNKRWLQLLAALWILVFHLWINVSGLKAEQYLIRIGYVGVDLFFFLSAYSLTGKDVEYGSFVSNRFSRIYLKFLFFVLVAGIYKKWAPAKCLKTALCISFFESGGGSFLWFVPAIMLFYLSFPLFLRVKGKYKVPVLLLIWLSVSLLLEYGFGYTKVFIFTNRIPVILAGYLLKKHDLDSRLGALCLPVGFALLYLWGFTGKLNLPIHEFYFVLAIPLVIGLGWLSGYAKCFTRCMEWKPLALAAGATLEVYAIQMIFGTDLVNNLYRLTKQKLLTNLLMLVIVVGGSVMLSVIDKEGRRWIAQHRT